MATIDSEVFRFVNLRAPGLVVNTSTTPVSQSNTSYIARAMLKPAVLPQEDWDDLLIQKLIGARKSAEDDGNEREAMLAILDEAKIPKILKDNIYAFNPKVQEVIDLANWIDVNASALDKATIRDRFIALYNILKSEEDATVDIATYNEAVESLNFAKVELKVWDFFVAVSVLPSISNKITDAVSRLLRLLHLAKSLKDYDEFPTASEEIYELFTAPIFLPDEIFPFPEAPVEKKNDKPEAEPLDEKLETAKSDYNKWKAAQITIEFLREQVREKQRQLASDFVVTYDTDGYPTNLGDMPKVEQEFLTPAIMTEYTQRCATTIDDDLQTGKQLIEEQYLCTETSRYSYDYIEKEINANLKKLSGTISALTSYTIKKVVMVNGTLMIYEEVKRGDV
jgi:hypothetical protein